MCTKYLPDGVTGTSTTGAAGGGDLLSGLSMAGLVPRKFEE
jgi:hypothetical protein